MRFQILHESPGRVRLKALQYSMSMEQADLLEAWVLALPGVDRVTVHERLGSLIIVFRGDRSALYIQLSRFTYEKAKEEVRVLSGNSRQINREYKEKMVFQVLWHYAKRLFLPAPLRQVINTITAIPRIWLAVKTLAQGKLNVEVLDGVAISASLLTGDDSTAGSVRFLLGLGDTLDAWTHKKSVDDLAKNMSLHVDRVWLLTDDGLKKEVPLSQIRAGDRIIVHTGHVLPLDGILDQGDVMINQASLTGESVPVAKHPGAAVYSGSVIEEGNCVVRVTHIAGENRYDRIVKMIEESERLKSNTEKKAYNLADRLVPWCLAGSALTYLLTGNITRAVSVLMVDFSCALKLAMPICVLSAMRECSDHHINVKGGKFLEAVAQADTIVFDKTGTLTYATPSVREIISFGDHDENELLRLAACLEEHFPHSIANAVVREAAERGLIHEERHTKVEYVVAHGIASSIKGVRALIGSWHFIFEDEKCTLPEGAQEKYDALPDDCSLLYLALDNKLAAVICIEDPIREEAKSVVEALHGAGFSRVVMMTGDSRRTAEAVAGRLGMDEFYAEVLPEDKAAFVKKEHEAGRKVVMIGDGINDSPALSEADAGIAISAGAAIAREIADITISAEDLRELVVFRRLSNALMDRINGNYRRIMTFNGLLIALGLLGYMPSARAALLHNLSTIYFSVDSMKDLL